jgi:hypothetical protein
MIHHVTKKMDAKNNGDLFGDQAQLILLQKLLAN